jgi:hypothetical protein
MNVAECEAMSKWFFPMLLQSYAAGHEVLSTLCLFGLGLLVCWQDQDVQLL